MIIQMAGLPGTGKTTIARLLAVTFPGTVVSKDAIRHSLFSPGQVTYDRDQDNFCAEVGFGVAAQVLQRDPGAVIIFDGRTCSRSYQVVRVSCFARRLGQRLRIIECTCAEQTACDRLSVDAAAARHPAANRDPLLYRALRAEADPVLGPKLVISTDQDLPSCVARCLSYLEFPEQGTGSDDGAWK
jgi:predicted kinase